MGGKNNDKTFLSFVIVTFNRIDELIECIESIKRQTYQEYEIVLVDNKSTDHTVEVVTRQFPDVKLICADTNLGVPGARNVGILHAKGDITIFIDDDCIIRDNYFCENVNQFFNENKETGILALKIVNYFTNKVHGLEFPHRNMKLIYREFETTYFVGAGFAVRREVFEKVGTLYEAYFYSLEEMDFSWRALEADYKIVYSPDFIVYHKASPLARPSWRKIYYSTRNRFWFCFTFLPWYYILTHLTVWMIFFFLASLRSNQLSMFFSGIFSGIKHLPRLKNRRKKYKLSKSSIKKIHRLQGRLVY